MFERSILSACVTAVLAVVMPVAAYAQVKPCPRTAQNYDRGTDPRAAGGQRTAQSYDRGTDPRAAGGQRTAQSYDRGTDPRAAGGQRTAQSYDRGTDPRAAGGQRTAQNYDRGTDPRAGGGGYPSSEKTAMNDVKGHVESTSADPSTSGSLQSASGTGCR